MNHKIIEKIRQNQPIFCRKFVNKLPLRVGLRAINGRPNLVVRNWVSGAYDCKARACSWKYALLT